ncbi:hypothetical protein ACL02U_21610 [Streptomyces sp. MS06]
MQYHWFFRLLMQLLLWLAAASPARLHSEEPVVSFCLISLI